MADETPVQAPPKRRGSRIGATIRALIRTRVTAGLFTILPIALTLWVVWLLFKSMRWASQWLVEAILEAKWKAVLPDSWATRWPGFTHEELSQPIIYWSISVFSVGLTFFLLYIVGLFAANIVGRRALGLVDGVVERVPLVKTVYRSLKQIVATFSSQKAQSFQRVALVPFPHEGMRCVAFVTNIFKDSVTGEELCSVFISTTPNPTTGYLQILRRCDITELNWTVEEGVRAVMSAGILRPDFITIIANKDLSPEVRSSLPPWPAPPDQPQDDASNEA
jgi:uncharacterized membrane protein